MVSKDQPTQLICKWCIYADRKEEKDAFKSRDKVEMKKHYASVHNINFTDKERIAKQIEKNPVKYGFINWEEKNYPLAKQLMFINGSYPHIQIRAIDRKEEKSIDLFLPSFPLEMKDKSEVTIPTIIEDKVYKITFQLNEFDDKNEPFYGISTGFHNDCMGCPLSYKKSFFNLSADEVNLHVQLPEKWEREVLSFKCYVNICKGIKKTQSKRLFLMFQDGDEWNVSNLKNEEKPSQEAKPKRKRRRKRNL